MVLFSFKFRRTDVIHYLRYSFYVSLLSQCHSQGHDLDVETANQAVLHWLNQVANLRVHGTTGQVPFQQLQEEQPYLQPIVPRYTGWTSPREAPIEIPLPLPGQRAMRASVASVQHPLSVYDDLLQEGVS